MATSRCWYWLAGYGATEPRPKLFRPSTNVVLSCCWPEPFTLLFVAAEPTGPRFPAVCEFPLLPAALLVPFTLPP